MADSATRTSPRKRKLSVADNTPSNAPNGTSSSAPKKAKVAPSKSAKSKKAAGANPALQAKPSNATEEFPAGSFYCHQCNKKRSLADAIQCTYSSKDASKTERCKTRYCRFCLKNRYGGDFEAIMARGEDTKPRGHVKGCGYIFHCPKCQGICNCRKCRKAQGLEPTGNLTLAARRAGAESAAAILGQNPSAQGILPGKGQQVEPAKKGSKVKAHTGSAGSSLTVKSKTEVAAEKPKTKSKPAAKPKPLPSPKWKAVETILDRSGAEDRIYLREFVLRFAVLLDISKTNLEELEDIDADYVRGSSRSQDEEGDICAWVSEPCVKAMIVGLLDAIAEESESNTKKAIREAVKEIRNSGANLTKIWLALATLRDNVTSGPGSKAIDFPDALDPPASATFRSTRSGFAVGNGIHVAESWQFIPILLSLVDMVMGTKAVKDEIDKGTERAKELHKECREEIKKENERWDTEKKGPVTKERRAAHKNRVTDLEQALETAMTAYSPRSGPLGKDADGRIYWVLPPGAAEREFSSALLSDSSKAKVTKKAMMSVEDREAMRRWSWFVAVWGKRPPKEVHGIDKSKKTEEEDDGEEKWWGFSDPKEIKTLADWIAIKFGVEKGRGSPGVEQRDSSRDTSVTVEDRKGKLRSASSSALPDTDGSSRVSTPLSELSDVDDEDELSELSEDDEDEERDVFAEGPATRVSMRNLVKGLRNYADLLAWRVAKWQKPAV